MGFPKIFLHPKKERSLKLFHPWVFSGAIARMETNIPEGETVDVFSSDGTYLATGHYHNGSIKVRLFSFTPTDADTDFWLGKLRDAFSARASMGLTDNESTDCYRLVHGEADGLPGLIIDVYGKAVVMQTHTAGMHKLKNIFAECLGEILSPETIYDKSSETMGRQGFDSSPNSFLAGGNPQTIVKENSVRFTVNWVEGQKTGFFLDQRDNRMLLQRYSKGKRVLNTFSYSGGFSMYALKGGAELVHSVDSSEKAIALAGENSRLNGFGSHAGYTADVFDFLRRQEESYDIIILDPPAFAKHLSAVENAMVGYRNLNTEGIRRVRKGGIVFTFSCSQVIDRMLFRKMIFQAAAQAKRNVRIVHQLSQGPDHPVSVYHPEGEYLKGLVLLVD